MTVSLIKQSVKIKRTHGEPIGNPEFVKMLACDDREYLPLQSPMRKLAAGRCSVAYQAPDDLVYKCSRDFDSPSSNSDMDEFMERTKRFPDYLAQTTEWEVIDHNGVTHMVYVQEYIEVASGHDYQNRDYDLQDRVREMLPEGLSYDLWEGNFGLREDGHPILVDV